MIEVWIADAQRLHQQGQLAQALSRLSQAVQAAPRDARVRYLLAAVLRDQGSFSEALQHIEKAIEISPNHVPVRYLSAQIHEDLGNVGRAMEALRGALRIFPSYAEAHHYLGVLLADQGRDEEALFAFRAAVRHKPVYPRAWNNLGSLLRDLGQGQDAERAFREAVRLQPDYAMGRHNLGLQLRDNGDHLGALRELRNSLALNPGRLETILALGNLLRTEGDLDASMAILSAGLRHDRPGEPRVQLALAFCLGERGDADAARQVYQAAKRSAPGNLRAALGEALTLPPIYQNGKELIDRRVKYSQGLDRLLDRASEWSGARRENLLQALQWSNFYLAYQGLDDRLLQEKYGSFVRAVLAPAAPEWFEPPPMRASGDARVRIGFASSFFTDSTVGHYFSRWITELPKEAFEVIVYALRPASNPIAQEIAKHAAIKNCAGMPFAEIVASVRRDSLDLLVYPELGMDSACFLMAALRLARVQCAAWGHPVTTGHGNIDVFLSAGTMEPPGAEVHYSEKLIRLPGIGTSYPRPVLPKAISRAELGLPVHGELILLPQSLFKIHPENDRLLVEILVRRPQARVVMFAARHEAITSALRSRLGRALNDRGLASAERLVILPYVPRTRFLQINLACDLMLDTLHWSGGNTSLDALACGLPIVTLPGKFMRGRQSAEMIRLSGAADLVAENVDEYVGLTAGLLESPERRWHFRKLLAEGAPALFDDANAIRALGNELFRLARDPGGHPNSPRHGHFKIPHQS